MFNFRIIDNEDKITEWKVVGQNFVGDSCLCGAMIPTRSKLPEMTKSLEDLVKEGVKKVEIIYTRD